MPVHLLFKQSSILRAVWVAALILLAGGWNLRAAADGNQPDEIRRWDVESLLKALEGSEPLLVLDVRNRAEWDLGHIRGAVHISLEDLAANLESLARDQEIVAYCSCPAEETSLAAARILRKAGYPKVGVLVGGYPRWKQLGGAVASETSFEEMFAVVEPPQGWGKRPSAQHSYDRDSQVYFRGEGSGRITGTASEGTDVGALFETLQAEGLQGGTVMLIGALRLEGVKDSAKLWIRAEDPAGKVLAFAQSEDPAPTGTVDWQTHRLELQVPAGSHQLMFGVMLSGVGTLWVDEVTLAEVSENGSEAPVALENAGFEN